MSAKLYMEAFKVSSRAHEGQKRRDGSPYFEHPKAVEKIIRGHMYMQNRERYRVLAFLHDVLEDSDRYTYDDLKEIFNKEIADEVEELTRKSTEKKVD